MVGVTGPVGEQKEGDEGRGQRSDNAKPAADQDYALPSPQDRLERGQGQ